MKPFGSIRPIPLTNAAANSLPDEEVGGGMGIFQGLLFLGAGTDPALVGAFLAARQEAGTNAINPAYTLDAAPFSDAFLVLAGALIVALVVIIVGIKSGIRKNENRKGT